MWIHLSGKQRYRCPVLIGEVENRPVRLVLLLYYETELTEWGCAVRLVCVGRNGAQYL